MTNTDKFISLLLSLPWLDLLAAIWKLIKRLWRGLSDEGMYEVLDHHVHVEILNKKGSKAHIQKRQAVRYLQNNILAYQDQAWGDGDILLNYQCSPGKEVDRYKFDHKMYILISLQARKQKGDTDEFIIDWDMNDGFTRPTEAWGSEISHKTKHLHFEMIFPKSRPPQKIWLHEHWRRKTKQLPQEALQKLADERWRVYWHVPKPRLHEKYMLSWVW